MNCSKPLLPAALVLALAVSAAAETLDRIVAVAGKKAVTQYELDQAYANDPILEELAAGPGEKLTQRQYLDRMIETMLVQQEVERQGIQVGPMEVEKAVETQREKMGLTEEQFQTALARQGITLDQYREKIKQDMIVIRLVGKEVRAEVEISQQEMETYYRQHPDRYATPEKLNLTYLLVPFASLSAAEKQALRIRLHDYRDALPPGRTPSQAAAELAAQGVNAAAGELGWFVLGELRPEFARAVEALPPGGLSAVVETDDGLYLFQVVEKTTGESVAFAEVKDQIQEELYQQEVMAKYEQWLERLKAKSHVEIRLPAEPASAP